MILITKTSDQTRQRVCVCVCVCVCLFIDLYKATQSSPFTCVFLCVFLCVYVHVCLCVYMTDRNRCNKESYVGQKGR